MVGENNNHLEVNQNLEAIASDEWQDSYKETIKQKTRELEQIVALKMISKQIEALAECGYEHRDVMLAYLGHAKNEIKHGPQENYRYWRFFIGELEALIQKLDLFPEDERP